MVKPQEVGEKKKKTGTDTEEISVEEDEFGPKKKEV